MLCKICYNIRYMSKSRVEGINKEMRYNIMDAIKTKMPKESQDLKEDLRTLTEGQIWFYLDNKAMTRLREIADEVHEISNLVRIQYGNTRFLVGPHTVGWWRLYSLDGEILFRESANPDCVVFLVG